ncbi:F420-non-reducing hydrogenase small subunit [Desulforamulus aeronauticus DSM 10349]|uniref:F420-non-reducing hydrogenase small subunit n=1 Tax=Desulforamulus aeronauticus DSM 10349 TaxID=1121421 RepID=A0A1M6TAF0_9FIRM|nr:F420-non-reducing hydrogenase small subunit [Desulforamulus aeronauticus DSM 10349]
MLILKKVVIEALSGCEGCEVSILDLGEELLTLLKQIEIIHAPIIMDSKHFDPFSNDLEIKIPRADIGILSGSIRTEENLEVARAVRENCDIVIANGTCACMGGIHSIANVMPLDSVKEGICPADSGADKYHLPKVTNRVISLNEVMEVDIYLPGCPPPVSMFVDAIKCVLEGRDFELPNDTVCNDCPKTKEKRTVFSDKGLPFPEMLRPLEPVELEDRCLFEQGYFCMGAATRSGCGGVCMKMDMPCRGCMGPRRIEENPRAELLGSLAVYGYTLRDVHDRRAAFNWFTGAHNNLRPIR